MSLALLRGAAPLTYQHRILGRTGPTEDAFLAGRARPLVT